MTFKKAKTTSKGKSFKIKSSDSNVEHSRMNFRLAPAIKERITRAAALSEQDLIEFAVTALSEKAEQIIERHDQILLSSDDHEFFLKALSEEYVHEPSEGSRSAAEKYRRGTRKGVRYILVD